MEGKSLRNVVVILLVIGLVVTEIEGAGCKYNVCYRVCRQIGGGKDFCAKKCNCTNGMVENSVTPARVSDYCKIGCELSVCENIATGFKTDAAEGEAKLAVEHCNNACSEICNDKVEVVNA